MLVETEKKTTTTKSTRIHFCFYFFSLFFSAVRHKLQLDLWFVSRIWFAWNSGVDAMHFHEISHASHCRYQRALWHLRTLSCIWDCARRRESTIERRTAERKSNSHKMKIYSIFGNQTAVFTNLFDLNANWHNLAARTLIFVVLHARCALTTLGCFASAWIILFLLFTMRMCLHVWISVWVEQRNAPIRCTSIWTALSSVKIRSMFVLAWIVFCSRLLAYDVMRTAYVIDKSHMSRHSHILLCRIPYLI